MFQRLVIAVFLAASVLHPQGLSESSKGSASEDLRSKVESPVQMDHSATISLKARIAILRVTPYHPYKAISIYMEFLNYRFDQPGEAPPDVTAEVEKYLQIENREIQQAYVSQFDSVESIDPVHINPDSKYQEWAKIMADHTSYCARYAPLMYLSNYPPPRTRWAKIGPNTLSKFDDDTIRKYNAIGRAHDLFAIWMENNTQINAGKINGYDFFEKAIFDIIDSCYNLAIYSPSSRYAGLGFYRKQEREAEELISKLKPSCQRFDAEFWAVVKGRVEAYRGLWSANENDRYHKIMLVELNRFKREFISRDTNITNSKVVRDEVTTQTSVHSNYSDADYFPFLPYARYDYKARDWNMVVVVMNVNDDKATFLQTMNIDGRQIITEVVYRKDANGVTSYQQFNDGTVSKRQVLRFPLKVGSKWSEPNEMLPGSVFVHKIVAVGVSVKVPAGEFIDCVRLEHFNSNGSKSGSSWYAPGVGLVKDEPAKGVLVKFREKL